MVRLRCLLIFILFIFFQNAWALDATDPDVYHQLAKLLSQYSSYQAQFTQVSYDEDGKVLQSTSGQFFLMRPNKFRWQTNQPTQQTIVANGNVFWIYDVDLMQATRRTIKPSNATDPAALLSGNPQDLSKQFIVSALQEKKNETVFHLMPKDINEGLRAVRLHFLQGKLQDLTVVNNLNQTSVFKFSNVKLNAKLNSQLFNFTPPPGVDVLKQ